MASYQARQRDPLLDQTTQAMLERRGRELLGLGLILLGLMFVMILGSYSPEDPGWMVATDKPAENMLGRLGAAVAATLVVVIGKGAWAIPLILLIWGGRFVLHRGSDRAPNRMIFAVLAVALASAYAATLVPGSSWGHAFGLGGLFGDTVGGTILGIIPGSYGFGMKLLSVLTFGALIAMLLYVTGFDMAELRAIRRFLLLGSIYGYSSVLMLAGKGAQGAAAGARGLQEQIRNRAEHRAAPQDAAWDYEPTAAPDLARRQPLVHDSRPRSAMTPEPLRAATDWNAPATLRAEPRYPATLPLDLPKEKLGFLARMRRVVEPEPELIEPTLSDLAYRADLPSEDRIKARISDVIQSRSLRAPEESAPADPAFSIDTVHQTERHTDHDTDHDTGRDPEASTSAPRFPNEPTHVMERPYILHMVTPGAQMSPFDV
ncbi:MAG: DNA translocase FtsK, partial [Tabrizicola sp.]|nr:DNA translocase FtsK [Tabrizicola sp.]